MVQCARAFAATVGGGLKWMSAKRRSRVPSGSAFAATRLSPARRRCTGKLRRPNCFTIKPAVVYFLSGLKEMLILNVVQSYFDKVTILPFRGNQRFFYAFRLNIFFFVYNIINIILELCFISLNRPLVVYYYRKWPLQKYARQPSPIKIARLL